MDLACHIRDISQLDRLEEVPEHLMIFYPGDGTPKKPFWPRFLSTHCSRIYVGDEFCAARLPSLSTLRQMGALAAKLGYDLTFLTPVMTDRAIDEAAPLLGYLNAQHPGAEVVFNDWGVMAYLNRHCPSLNLSAGRILNKGFKDPRFKPAPDADDDAAMRADSLLNGSTFDGRWIQEQLLALNINRCEQDLLPYQANAPIGGNELDSSIYFPFGYVTSGRTCWPASFDQSPGEWFIPPDRCSRPCRHSILELKSDRFEFRIFQQGNTIFYLYPMDRLDRLLPAGRPNGLRLVYQGFGFDAS